MPGVQSGARISLPEEEGVYGAAVMYRDFIPECFD